MLDLLNTKIKLPQNDKANSIFNLIFGLPAIHSLYVAHQLNLFEIIEKNSMSLENIAKSLKLEIRPTQALLSMCTSLDLIELNTNGKFQLTDIAKDYLLKKSPFYVGGVLDMTFMNADVYSFKSIKQALSNNQSQVYEGKELFQTNEEEIELAKIFTRSMHGKSINMAGMWPNKLDLSQYTCFLDIGGGSGAHSIGAILRWENLQAIIYERPIVCEVAQEYIEQFGLRDQISTHVGDMWKNPFPPADIHFYCDIFHDWPMEKCRFLAEKSYKSLASRGRIILHEMLFNDNKTGPLPVASYNTMMLLWTQGGQQFSQKELVTLLKECGFVDVKAMPTGFGDWSLITGIKV